MGVGWGNIYYELFRLPAVCLHVEVEEEDRDERAMDHHKTDHRFWIFTVLNEEPRSGVHCYQHELSLQQNSKYRTGY